MNGWKEGALDETNSPIKTQDLSKDKNQNHADEDAALGHVGAHALVTHDANAVSSRETRHANRNAASEMHKATEQAVVGLRVEVLGDQDRDDEGVDSDDTGHDDGDEALQTRERRLAGWRRRDRVSEMESSSPS